MFARVSSLATSLVLDGPLRRLVVPELLGARDVFMCPCASLPQAVRAVFGKKLGNADDVPRLTGCIPGETSFLYGSIARASLLVIGVGYARTRRCIVLGVMLWWLAVCSHRRSGAAVWKSVPMWREDLRRPVPACAGQHDQF